MLRCIADFKYRAYRNYAILQIIIFTTSLNKYHERHITVRVYLIATERKINVYAVISLYFDV